MKILTNQSDLSSDPEIANFIFECAGYDESQDPLNILLQRELEQEEYDAEYPYLAPCTTCN